MYCLIGVVLLITGWNPGFMELAFSCCTFSAAQIYSRKVRLEVKE